MTPDLALTSRRTLLRSWRDASCLILVAALLPLFFIQPAYTGLLVLLSTVSNLGHVAFFALLTLLIHGRQPLTTMRRRIAVTMFVLVVSIAIELIQAQIGRTASAADILRNLLGTWAVIFWQQSHRPVMHFGRFAVSLLIMAELVVLALSGVEVYQSLKRFPILNTLETAGEMRQWRSLNSDLSRSQLIHSEGQHALRIAFSPGDFSGAILSGFPADWTSFTHLHLDLHSADDEILTVTLRIHDRQHELGANAWKYEDRFNQSFQLQPGWNHLSIPLARVTSSPAARLMDLRQIRELQIFVASGTKPKAIHVDNLRLEIH